MNQRRPARRVRDLLCGLAGLCALACPAFAGEPVSLRADPEGHAGVVTLGDLFDGVQGRPAAVVVGHAATGQEAVLEAGEVQLAARTAGLDWANSAGQRRIIVAMVAASAARPARTRHGHARVQADAVLVYPRSLAVGEVVQAADLPWSDDAVAGSDVPGQPETVIGLAARLPLRAGAAVSTHELVAPKVIRRDQMVSVDYAADGVSLSLSAKALGDAAVGDSVQVINLTSKKTIDAVATGPGHAAVGPIADTARATPFRTAVN